MHINIDKKQNLSNLQNHAIESQMELSDPSPERNQSKHMVFDKRKDDFTMQNTIMQLILQQSNHSNYRK